MAIHVDHIKDVSFKSHFLDVGSKAPRNGLIEVNDNAFEVSFDNGHVNARFTSGNWFTNLFRGKTMSRFKETLQTQYDNWIRESAKAPVAQTGFKDNANVQAVKTELNGNANVQAVKTEFKDNANVQAIKTAVDECFDILHSCAPKLDPKTLNCSKDVLKAYGTLHEVNGEYKLSQPLNEHDLENFERYIEVMPKNLGVYAKRLGVFADLAAIRNDLTTMATGTEIAAKLLGEYGILTHPKDNVGNSEEAMKKHLLNAIDTILDGFLNAVNAMNDKSVELFRFLDKFDGVCLEAKSDNVQDWFIKSSGDIKEARSTEKDNLAFCVAAEFKAIADEVEAPFRADARKACEAEVRAACEKEGIVDEVQIEQRIALKVDTIIYQKEEKEITPLIHKKIEEEGKFALYENLVGANRPVTVISKKEGSNTWKVTTFKDENNKPILKPVSAFDIDKQFEKFLAMYKEDAVLLNKIEQETKTVNVKMGNRKDLFAKDVINTASATLNDDNALKDLCQRVKNQMRVKLDLPDAEFENAVRRALGDILSCKSLNAEDTERNFSNFIRNYADSSYADQLSDVRRLANLVARRVENVKAYYDSFLADLDGKAGRCAQMLKSVYQGQNKVVDVKEAQKAIATTLRTMIERIKADPNNPKNSGCKSNLGKIMFNGRLFTDELTYDMSHRAAGGNEHVLHTKLSTLLKLVEHYGKIDPKTFVHKNVQEVQA